MSDSDSSEDETNKRLLSAIDTSFLNDKLFTTPSTVNDTKKSANVKTIPCATKQPVAQSNRYITEEDASFHSDLNVTALVQKHVAEKLANLIGSVIEFEDFHNVDQVSPTKSDKLIDKSGIKLLKGFDEVVDLNAEEIDQPFVQLKPKAIKRRKVDCEPEVNEDEKLSSAICDPSTFPKEVQQWKGPRKRSTQFQYKTKQDGKMVQKTDPDSNEFTKARNANMWHESKIRKFKKHA
ncbi:uncharacterized protein LOC126567129 [Anopheles maculipalpis]|uniref:uncharacterized protein LOC126567129 n=1 Tax=Anopheles maculipalpis TaxID=1496333 RepID=UPI002158EF68|nr:uncharacterized protein LOC126567129 [Anopheles maculipalpis]